MSADPGLPPPGREDGAFRHHRTRDAALVLPLAGLVLIAPPLVNLFVADVTLFGAPLIGVYLFTVWGGLIVCARQLARRLSRGERPRYDV